MDRAEPVRIEELLAHSGWLRRLAARLVRDSAAADDLVQDTWITALEHPPRGELPVRPWLARVARNLAHNRRRGEARRSEHESAVHDERESVSPSRIAEEIEAQRTLADLVLALDEPLRTTVVLRYFRGLDASAISRLQAVPAGTVRWRLKQALDRMRGELDVRFGRRDSWCIAFGAFLARDATTPISLGATGAAAKSSMALGGTIVSSGTKIGIAVLCVAIGVGVWSLWPGETEPKAHTVAVVETTALPSNPLVVDAVDGSGAMRRAPVAASNPTDVRVAPPAVASLVASDCCIVGRVVDSEGRPIDGATVRARLARIEDDDLLDTRRTLTPLVTVDTKSDGGFVIPAPIATPIELTCTRREFAPVVSGPWFAGQIAQFALDDGATLTVTARVKSDAKPIAGAIVRVSHPRLQLSSWRAGSSTMLNWSAMERTTADGSCVLRRIPAGRVEVSIDADGFAPDVRVVEMRGTEAKAVSFELTFPGSIEGVVRDARTGEPIAGAHLGAPFAKIQTREDGRFRCERLPLDGMSRTLQVTASGYAPGQVEFRLDEHRRTQHLELPLEAEVRALGRAVDANGRPIEGASIECTAEASTAPFVSTRIRSSAKSDSDGRFELRGLLSGVSYRLVARTTKLAPSLIAFGPMGRPSTLLELGDITLGPGGDIEGLVDTDLTIARELLVRLHIADAGHDLLRRLSRVSTTRPDAKGRFAFARLPAGRFELELVRVHDLDRGGEERTLAATTVELGAGETRRDVVLRAGSAAIEGVVVAPDGMRDFLVQLSGGSLDADGIAGRTDEEGRFRVWVDGAGPFRLSIADPRLFCAPKSIDGVQPGDRALRVELERFHSTHVIRGRIVQRSGEPVSEAYVSFTDTTTGQRLGRVAIPDERGRFEMKDLNDVPYDLELFDARSLYLPTKIVGVKPGGADVEMQLVPRM